MINKNEDLELRSCAATIRALLQLAMYLACGSGLFNRLYNIKPIALRNHSDCFAASRLAMGSQRKLDSVALVASEQTDSL